MITVALDTETAMIRPGVQAPELACVSHCNELDRGLLHASNARNAVGDWLEHNRIVGHNVRYDMAVFCANFPDLLELVFRAYDEDRVTDTELRDRLIHIATGKYKGWFDERAKVFHSKPRFNLAECAKRYLGRILPKDDHVRLAYGPLRTVPLEHWPAEMVEYASNDAVATFDVWTVQETAPPALLVDQYNQARSAFWLGLASARGLRTSVGGVTALQREAEKRLESVKAFLIERGLVRAKDGSRDMKAAYAEMERACADAGIKVRRNDPTPRFPEGSVQLDEDACKAVGDPVMLAYAEYSVLGSILSKDIPLLAAGTTYPIHTHFSLAETGRTTSSKPNIQNFRRAPSDDEDGITHGLQGIRECFVPRPGYVFFQADYPALELRTLAQVCVSLFGKSTLADVLNSGLDPHTALAADILGVTYEYAVENKDRDDEIGHRIDNARQTAKVANFGFPGGLGYRTLILFARKSYNVILTEDQARKLKNAWMNRWPEMREYFALVTEETDLGAPIRQLFSERLRGGCTYTAACNTKFQGLGADAAKYAGWLITKACYIDRSSPMYGSRIVNFVHDEIIGECRDDARAHDVAVENARLMKDGANRYLPDCPFKDVKPVLMRLWSKKAKPLYGPDGRLIPWAPSPNP